MDGNYILKNDVGFKPDPNCIDGCIYYKNTNINEEYCFAPVLEEETSASLFCQVKIQTNNWFCWIENKYLMQNDDEYEETTEERKIDASNSKCKTNHQSFLLSRTNK